MKSYCLMVPLICLICSVAQAKENSLRTIRFVEASSIYEKDGLPPKIMMVFDIFCNEELAQVIRHEKTDPKSNKVTIAVGALVQENLFSSCTGIKRKLTVEAGTTFSGREYEIIRIKN